MCIRDRDQNDPADDVNSNGIGADAVTDDDAVSNNDVIEGGADATDNAKETGSVIFKLYVDGSDQTSQTLSLTHI